MSTTKKTPEKAVKPNRFCTCVRCKKLCYQVYIVDTPNLDRLTPEHKRKEDMDGVRALINHRDVQCADSEGLCLSCAAHKKKLDVDAKLLSSRWHEWETGESRF